MERTMTWAAPGCGALLLASPVGAMELPAAMRSHRSPPLLTEEIGTGVRYANSSATKRYDLKLLFASTPDHLPVTYVGVGILDRQGSEERGAGCRHRHPWLLANLPAAIYRVTATAHCRPFEQNTEIAKGAQTEISFDW